MAATFKAPQLTAAGAPFATVDKPVEAPPAGKVRVKVHACGVCHGDVVPKFGLLGTTFPRVPGHEIAGVVDAVGAAVEGAATGGARPQWTVGDRVGLGWFGGCCATCRSCREGDLVCCDHLAITGAHFDGGYQPYVTVAAHALAKIPDELTFLEAAPLMCAGLTVFNSLRHAGASPGATVGVQGMGGLGHLAVQYASKMGYEVVVFSRGRSKEAEARRLGAQRYVDTTEDGFQEKVQAQGGINVLLATAPSASAMTAVLPVLAKAGTLVLLGVGGHDDCTVLVDPGFLIAGRRKVMGFPSGQPSDAEDALRFAARHGIRPINEVFPASQASEAFDRMMSKQAIFRVVLDHAV
ncbi:unnamed protein product [Closterium sp. Naga37s-1]|nr:unnamed protein product [Closterium sp. Naga37s-1]